MTEFLTMGEAVKRFRGRFRSKVIRRWLERGWIDGACQTGPGGHWSIPARSLERFVDSLVVKGRKKRSDYTQLPRNPHIGH